MPHLINAVKPNLYKAPNTTSEAERKRNMHDTVLIGRNLKIQH